MTPEDLLAEMHRRQLVALSVPSQVRTEVATALRPVASAGVRVGVTSTADGIRVRVLSTNRKISTRAAAARIRPVVVATVTRVLKAVL